MRTVLCLLLCAGASRADPPPMVGAILPTHELILVAEAVNDPERAATDWPRWRFVSFAAAPVEEQAQRRAAFKFAVATLNRTASTPDQYLRENSTPTIAVDIAALGWPPAFWDSVAKGESYYAAAGLGAFSEFFRSKFGTPAPILRHDEFMRRCWEPDCYVQAIQPPATRRAFRETFLVPNFAELGQFGVVSDRLTVTKHPGQVARLPGVGGITVWTRVLHAKDEEVRLSPGDMEGDHYEFLWTLPNGMLGCASYDATNQLALTGSTTLSKDSEGETVRIGVSCIGCHKSGIRPLEHADTSDRLLLLGLRREAWDKDTLQLLAGRDQRAWAASLLRINSLTPQQNASAASLVRSSWDSQLAPADVARELGVQEQPGDSVSRAQFTDIVAAAAAGRVNRRYIEAVRRTFAR